MATIEHEATPDIENFAFTEEAIEETEEYQPTRFEKAIAEVGKALYKPPLFPEIDIYVNSLKAPRIVDPFLSHQKYLTHMRQLEESISQTPPTIETKKATNQAQAVRSAINRKNMRAKRRHVPEDQLPSLSAQDYLSNLDNPFVVQQVTALINTFRGEFTGIERGALKIYAAIPQGFDDSIDPKLRQTYSLVIVPEENSKTKRRKTAKAASDIVKAYLRANNILPTDQRGDPGTISQQKTFTRIQPPGKNSERIIRETFRITPINNGSTLELTIANTEEKELFFQLEESVLISTTKPFIPVFSGD